MTTHIFLDTETTGLGPFGKEPRKDQIIEVAFVWEEDGKIQKIHELCNPGNEYLENAEEALKVQGRTKEEVNSFQEVGDAIQSVRDQLVNLKGFPMKTEFHAWNIGFDKFFIEQHPWKIGLNWGEDPMVLASRKMGYSYDRIGLAKAAAYFEIELPEDSHFHSALADAYMAMMIYKKIKGVLQ